MRAYEYRHVVGFEETNLVGNVYYVNHLRWQGRCREMFLREHAPSVLQALAKDLALATVRCSCDYLRELNAFDEIVIRMRLASAQQHRLSMEFEYWRQTSAGEELVARGARDRLHAPRRRANRADRRARGASRGRACVFRALIDA